MTPDLEAYLQGIEGVTNYVRGTFSLFDVARSRRPKKLLNSRTSRRTRGSGGDGASKVVWSGTVAADSK